MLCTAEMNRVRADDELEGVDDGGGGPPMPPVGPDYPPGGDSGSVAYYGSARSYGAVRFYGRSCSYSPFCAPAVGCCPSICCCPPCPCLPLCCPPPRCCAPCMSANGCPSQCYMPPCRDYRGYPPCSASPIRRSSYWVSFFRQAVLKEYNPSIVATPRTFSSGPFYRQIALTVPKTPMLFNANSAPTSPTMDRLTGRAARGPVVLRAGDPEARVRPVLITAERETARHQRLTCRE
jgi:hypothetical protein